MTTVILVIHGMLALALIGVVLLQRSEGGGLGLGSGQSSFMSVRGQANLLTRSTAILAGSFMATSMILAILAGMHRETRAFMDEAAPAATAPAEAGAPATGTPTAPAETVPATPAAPAAR